MGSPMNWGAISFGELTVFLIRSRLWKDHHCSERQEQRVGVSGAGASSPAQLNLSAGLWEGRESLGLL